MKLTNRIEEIHSHLFEECEKKGKVERIDYSTTDYSGKADEKYAFVYTPYNYDPKKKYNILYLIHGGDETAEKYLYMGGEENPLKRAVDNMIAEESIEPVIIVTPTFYPANTVVDLHMRQAAYGEEKQTEERQQIINGLVTHFSIEIVDLMKTVETRYSTYAENTTDEALIAARVHRNVMGWSMGCVTTWNLFISRLAYFHDFGFLSGSCSVIPESNTKEFADETAKIIVEKVKEQGYGKKDYHALSITGTLDIAYEKCTLIQGALLAYPELFDFHSEEQNASFVTWAQGEHHTQWRLQYTINAIKQFYTM